MQQASGVRAVHTASDVLRCAGNSLGDAGAAALAPALRTMSQLTSLNLAGTTARARARTRSVNRHEAAAGPRCPAGSHWAGPPTAAAWARR